MADPLSGLSGIPNVTSYTAVPPLPSAQNQDYSGLGSTPSNFLFNRAYSFEIGDAEDAVKYTRLRIAFEIEKTSQSASNKARIMLYNSNLSLQSSADFKGDQIILRAGYGYPQADGSVPGLPVIFSTGLTALARIINSRKGPDVITEFQITDSNIQIENSTFDQSYPIGTPLLLIVGNILSAMGLSPYIYDPTAALATPLAGALVVTGPAKFTLTNLLARVGYQWNVDSKNGYGTAYIYPKGSAINPITIVAAVVSQATGLIGVPNQSNAEGNVVEFTSLMNGNLDPGRVVQLKSATVTGIFIIRNTKIEGDSHGNKWQATCQCLPPSNAIFPAIQGVGSTDVSVGGIA